MRAARARAGAVAFVATVAVVIFAVPASAAGQPANRPPTVSQPGTSSPTSPCVVGAARPTIRSTTPTLGAVLTDPENQNVVAAFGVLDSRGRPVWVAPRSAAQASGSVQTVQVPSGKLVDGGTYTWFVSGRDAAGRWAVPRFCQLTVDVAAPATPVVTPVAGEPAVYAEDATAGGVGLRGTFTFSDAATDVSSYTYLFDAGPTASAPASSPTATYTPDPGRAAHAQRPGRRPGGERQRDAPLPVHRRLPRRHGWGWSLAPGRRRGDGRGRGLRWSSADPDAGTGWTAGALAEVAGRPADRALLLDSPTDGAQTAGPVLATTGSFTVTAFARLDAVGTGGTVLSQDGTSSSAFALGYTTQGCSTGVTACWSFALPTQDAAGSPQTVVRSVGAVEPGSWVQLTGVHDATTGSVSLFVCTIGSAAKPGTLRPTQSGPVPFTTPWSASGAFRVGQGFAGSDPFTGAVSSVRVIEGVAQTLTDVRVSCSAGA